MATNPASGDEEAVIPERINDGHSFIFFRLSLAD
jgi:hypothetical protein